MKTTPWACSACETVVFMPEIHQGKTITGSVCTQQKRRGCEGELSPMGAADAAAIRATMRRNKIGEQPWLTLVFERRRPS